MTEDLTVDGRYHVVFTGLPVYGQNVAEVRQNIKRRFRLSAKKLDSLFSGRTVQVGRNLSWEDARRFQARMKKLGALCEILPQEDGNEEQALGLSCPSCRSRVTGDTCNHCGFNLLEYRLKMRSKGFVELPGGGFVEERRALGERRDGTDRRDGVRFEDDRRSRNDRRGWRPARDEIF